jgi:DNA anti-recombination protein RmuC
MDRNYDEIISEMLRQIDRHSEQLTRQSEKLELQTARLEATVQKSDDFWREQRVINAEHLRRLDELEQRIKDQQSVVNQNLELVIHTAGILDRIIKKNALQL